MCDRQNGPPETRERAAPLHHQDDPNQRLDDHQPDDHSVADIDTPVVASQQVSFWSVHEFVQRYLETAGCYPPAGTPAWCELADGDRRKWAALLDFAQHHALRVETAQEADCQASHDVSASADWSAIAQRERDEAEFYAVRPWMKRVAS